MSELSDKLREDLVDGAPWSDIRPHVARVVIVHELDIIVVGIALACDERDRVEGWLGQGRLERPSDDILRRWEQAQPTFRMLIVTPWVLLVELPDDVAPE